MTTLTTPDGPSEVINARRTESLDAPNILKLTQSSTESLFGRVDVVNLIEKSVLAVTLSNDKEEVLGHAAFLDYPNLPEVDPAEWEAWMNAFYDCSKCTAMNTLFMHYFVAKQEYSHGCAEEIIRTMFNAVPQLHYCFLVVPTGVYPDAALADIFKQIDRLEGGRCPDNCVVFACYRHEHVPVLHVRPARVEDHDDLVPIFNRQSDMLSNTYGDFFLAELIEANDDNMKCIVAEVEGTAVGFMSLSNEVNADLLNKCFELGPFHGLRVPHPEDQTDAPKTPSPAQSPPLKEDRPTSVQSNSSRASRSSHGSRKSSSGPGSYVEQKGIYQESRSSSQMSSLKGSFHEEPRMRRKLSDGNESLIEDCSDAESVKSDAICRELTDHTPTQAAEMQAPGAIEEVTPKYPVLKPQAPKRFVPSYKGAISAFSIQLFCIDERFETRSCDFLPKAFELFPQCDFCVMTLPHLVPEFPLLQQFVRMTPRMPSTLAQELYVFSRAGLLGNFRVRRACTKDVEGVSRLVDSLHLSERLLADLQQYNTARRDTDGGEIQAFVAECSKQVVGVCVIRREEDIEYVRSHYNIEDFIYYNHHRREEHGHLHHYALNPCFKHYSKLFLKEILRLGHKTCLYYPLYPSYTAPEILEKHSLVAALSDMVPVRARRQIVYPLNTLGENAPSDRVLKEQEKYALNHISRKLTLEPKVTINARIVVVGASDVGIGFLETFAFCPHLRFNNLTLISPHGLPGELPPDALRAQMLGSSLCYTQDEYAQMALRAWVNLVYGKMTAINRKKKHVTVNHNTVVPYDHLILCMGTQYQFPSPTEADITQLVTNNELPNTPDRRVIDTPPSNVFVMNDSYEAAVALCWSEHNLLNNEDGVVIYGNGLEAYTCVQTLMSLGIAGSRIALVEPPNTSEVTAFNNIRVEQAVGAALQEAGVRMYSGYILAQWNDGEMDCPEIHCASFTSNTKPIRIECKAFFSFYKKVVDFDAFQAINDSCLVFDGRLVIDANFHTTDLSIRGAGPLTKFQRSYHADQWSHGNFNSKEVGIQLASNMLTLFDPTLEPEPEPPQDLLKLIPMYRSPKVTGAVLPGGFYYLHVCKPGLPMPLDALMAQNDCGRELVTGSTGGENAAYFRLHINQYSSVEAITCLAKKDFAASNLICLYGLHERCLNNLCSRFDEGLIRDFYQFFNETWCLAVFHDRFPDFRDEVRELLITRPAATQEALEETVRQLIEEDLMLNKSQRNQVMDEYSASGAKRAVETRMLSFLSYNYYHLPMYAKPGMV